MPNNTLKIWTTLLGTTESDYGYSVTIGLDGSVFVGGTTNGALDGEINSSGSDAYLTKYTVEGKKEWSKLLGFGFQSAQAVTTGLDGSIYLSGWTNAAIDGQVALGNIDAFLTKYSADGLKVWTKLLGSSRADVSHALTIGLDGSIYVGGQTEGSFDGQVNSGADDAFLTKYSPDGTKIWTKFLGTSSDDEARSLTTGLDGSIYISGWTSQALDGQAINGDQDAYLTKYSPDGSKIWTRLLGTNRNDQANTLTVGLDGSIYVGGRTEGSWDGQVNSGAGDAFLTKYSPDGTKIWTRLLGTNRNDQANALTVGLDGSIYLGGFVQGSLDGNAQIGLRDAFLTKYSPDGAKAWTKLLGSSGEDEVLALTTGLDGSIYLTGSTDDSFDGLTGNGGVDSFIVRFQTTINNPSIKLSYDASISKVFFKLSGPSKNFSVESVSVTGGTLRSFAGEFDSYSAIFFPDSNSLSNATIKVASGAFSDLAGNLNTDGADSDNLVSVTLSGVNTDSPPSNNPTTPVISEVPFIPYGSGRYFLPSSGAEKITGTAFLDVVRQNSNQDANQISKLNDGSWRIQNKANPTNTDTLVNIERVDFSDVSVALDVNGSAGQVAKILGAIFGSNTIKNPNFMGIGLAYLDDGMSYKDLGKLAADAAGLSTPDALVSNLWKNVVGFTATEANKAPFIKLLNDGMSIGELVTLAADSSLNTQSINLSELTNTGISYTPFVIPSVSTKPTYSLSSSQTFINEGASALFTLTTTNVVAGTSIPYLISGITANDLLIGELSGTLIVGSNGTGTISIPIAADNLTEGPETFYIKIESYRKCFWLSMSRLASTVEL